MKEKRLGIVAIILLWIFIAIIALKSTTKLTYLEYEYENENADDYIKLKRNNEYIEQVFESPYEIMHGIAIKVGTFVRDNNSTWNIALIDNSNGNVLYSKVYNASLITDNSFHLFKFDKNIKVKKGKEYAVRVSAINVNDNTCIAYYVGSKQNLKGAVNNGTDMSKSLCFSVYGGDFDVWWLSYSILIGMAISFSIIRATIVSARGQKLVDDTLFVSMISTFIVLLLLNSFSVFGDFTDEWDNIRGGILISKGGVLYRDYITQHTPVMYYLCGIFAFLGAGSLQQFRLSYYLLEAIIWGFLYARHSKFFGKTKLFFLIIFESVFVTSVLGTPQGYMILSDGMHGLCMVALLLEFLQYYKDRKIGWDRAIIISLSIWGSFGSAFISVYAILFVVISVIGLEIAWNKDNGTSMITLINRYYKLIICIFVPFFSAVIYFKVNHALKCAFEQFYLFNREVYSKYISIGDNIFEPFITSEQYFFGIIADKFNAIIASTATNADILQFAIATAATAVVVTMCMKKRYVECFTLFTVMIFSAPRGYGFHGVAAWYVAIMIIVLFGEDFFNSCIRKVSVPTSVIITIILISIYAKSVGSNLLYEQQPISEIESRIIALTNDNEKIFLNAWNMDSIYISYKTRYPVNRACYILPWYMDWYEQDTIDDLNTNNPNIVVYNPDQEVWGYKYYSNAFSTELKKNYKQFSENPEEGWKYMVWMKK